MDKISKRITKKEVEHVAWLAKIKLSEDEMNLFTEQFNSILEYFRIIDEAETDNVPPSFHAVDLTDVLREDIVEPSLSREKALANASKKEKGFFKSPKIL
ncbi:Asp-tRNA(Asn)/Glu-tRNA(Gln) amidotransferase subunit GatC [Candidatus Bathyarchaeota archaeon]|nr:Asp-tRNA(Asn)/Glu-tRNA(Gln) amidotransferase subunit GatC [Candidatus Bathyarchaeota archaeon]MCK5625321.1 Asp-tRNA(Asn)/Glu-tRNA(Gln) amidotransferase subunit GatC [Candidatus Bathyarchaeota archaeon]